MRQRDRSPPAAVVESVREIEIPGGISSPREPGTERAWVEIDLGALQRNVRAVRGLLRDGTKLLAVVKADAYGHGALTAATAAIEAGSDALGVATLEEGLALREAGIATPILVLGFISGAVPVERALRADLQLTVCSAEHALEVASATAGLAARDGTRDPRRAEVHLKIDTGLSRLGERWESTGEFLRAVRELERWLQPAGLYSHLACADRPERASPEPTSMETQRRRFASVLRGARAVGLQPQTVHLANTAATLTDPRFHYDMVRIGLALYGMAPAPHLESIIPLEPVLEVKARITQVKPLRRGEAVSYGGDFVADRDLTTATVGIGYADGVSLRLSGRMTAIVGGRRVRQLGRITMDQLVLDVTDLPGARAGDVVTLIGRDGSEHVSVFDWARELGTIPWEVLCLFHRRLPRVAVS